MKRIKIQDLLRNEKVLKDFCESMKDGGTAVIPTDTLYGFAVSYSSIEAVNKIYQIKNRDARKPLILFVTSIYDLEELGLKVTGETKAIIEKNWPGALTAVLPKPQSGELAAFAFPSIGVRAPDHKELLELLDFLPVKLLTTSANRSGASSDTNPDNIEREFAEEIDWLIDGGTLPCGTASTVVDFSFIPPKILRQGKVVI